MTGGCWAGYEEASVRRMSDIWAQGAAHGVWKEMQTSAVGRREEMLVWNWGAVVISVTSDMVTMEKEIRGDEGRFVKVVVSSAQMMMGGQTVISEGVCVGSQGGWRWLR